MTNQTETSLYTDGDRTAFSAQGIDCLKAIDSYTDDLLNEGVIFGLQVRTLATGNWTRDNGQVVTLYHGIIGHYMNERRAQVKIAPGGTEWVRATVRSGAVVITNPISG